jgi:hypothetical protein
MKEKSNEDLALFHNAESCRIANTEVKGLRILREFPESIKF